MGVFLCSAQSKGSDKVHVEATYCQSVLDNSATGEILEYTLRAWNWSQKKKSSSPFCHLWTFLPKWSQGLLIDKSLLVFSMLPSRRELADGNWVQISPCKTRTLQPDCERVHVSRWNEWLLERKFNRQVRASVHVHKMRWERERETDRERD